MLNILIPCAGTGQRFKDKGYGDVKPLIPVNGVPMLRKVIRNVTESLTHTHHRVIVVGNDKDALHEHVDCFHVGISSPTEGAACTCLAAESWISNDDPLLVCNCDQLIDGGIAPLLETDAAGAVLTMFKFDDPRWSYAESREGYVEKVWEKRPVGNRATTGHYWWGKGSDFVESVRRMIEHDDRTNGEFYVAPAYNYFDKLVRDVQIESYGGVFHGLGTPEDLEWYLETHKT